MTGPGGSNLNSGEADPFAHLHKMSTTAGLGSGDYVAINGSAVAAILLGVGSALVFFNIYFLVLPLLGVILSILSFMQISRSNGTQTGQEVAIIGLLLSLGFGGFCSCKAMYSSFRNHADEEQIVSLVHRLGEDVKEKDYASAYNLFDTQFKKRIPLADFESAWQRVSASPVVGSVYSIDWNHLLSSNIDPVSGERISNGMMLMKAKPSEPLRISMSFRNEEGNWLIDQIPQFFPEEDPSAPKPPAPRGGPSSPAPLMGPPKPN